jgi:hypothetical protein
VCLSVCLCVRMYVCLCICVSVCPAIRFHISQRIVSKFGGNIQRVMIRIVGYLFCLCTQRVRVRAKRARMCAFAYFANGFSPNLLGTCNDSPEVNILQITTSSKGYVLFTHPAWLNIQLSLDGFYLNLMGTYYK